MIGRGRGAAALLLLTWILVAAPAAAASRYDPRLKFRTLSTAHFVIYFHQGEEGLARRLRDLVEPVHERLTARLKTTPRGVTHIVLVDQNDTANGWANPYPYNTIEITAAAPTPGDAIGNFDDWLTLVFTHEYTHILHLDRSEGWAAVGRHVLGRSPYVMPNLYLPLWQIEGIATFEESVNTGRGRIPAGDFNAIVEEAAGRGRPDPIDRVNGGLIAWPAGAAHYAYGAYFHEYLAARFGEDTLADLARATASRFPYTGSWSFRSIFGEPLGDLWKAFERARVEEAERHAIAAETAGRRVTRRGFLVRGPRFLPPLGNEPAAIAYSSGDQHDFPALYAVEPGSGRTQRLATRVGGARVGVGRETIVFDQLEVARNTAVRGDLYALDRRGGGVRRLTHGLRVADPDLSPDGRTVACVVIQPGARALALLDVRDPRAPTIVSVEPETQYAAPRWSPDGRTIAAERLRLGGPSEIVLVDVSSHDVRPLVAWPDARSTSPAWMPDGRTLLFASARGRDPFDIFAVDVDASPPAVRRVTTTRSGATFPDVSSDGRTLAYVGYTGDGYDVFTLPLDRETWRAIETPVSTAAPSPHDAPPEAAFESHPYRPFTTLLPRAWFPILSGDEFQLRLGAETSGADVLGRHSFSAAAAWGVGGERRPALQEASRPNWGVSYAYDRWRPTLFASASESDTLYPLVRGEQGRTTELLERHGSAGVVVPFVRMRHSHTVLGAINYERDVALNGSRQAVFERSAFRTGWAFANAKSYGYSISSEQGVVVGVTTEHVRRAIGADGNADAATIDARAYLRAGPRHAVVAVRAAGGVSEGDANVRRTFDLGGSGSRLALFDFGRDALSMMRGFPRGTFSGTRLVNVNVEYRAPLWRVERGHGTWPFFIQTLHAAIFADAGHAWNRTFALRDVKSSFGGEMAVDLVAGYYLPVTIAVGAAFGQKVSQGLAQSRYYLRIGRAF